MGGCRGTPRRFNLDPGGQVSRHGLRLWHPVVFACCGVVNMYVTAQNPDHPQTVNLWLSHADIEDGCGGWSSNASYLASGYGLRVMVEGLDWQNLCRLHGLYGAIGKTKEEARRRYARTGYPVPIKKSA